MAATSWYVSLSPSLDGTANNDYGSLPMSLKKMNAFSSYQPSEMTKNSSFFSIGNELTSELPCGGPFDRCGPRLHPARERQLSRILLLRKLPAQKMRDSQNNVSLLPKPSGPEAFGMFRSTNFEKLPNVSVCNSELQLNTPA